MFFVLILNVGTFLPYYPKRNICVHENCPTNFSMSNVSDVYFGGVLFETRFGKRRAQLFRGFLQFLETHSKVYFKLAHNYTFPRTSHFIIDMRRITTNRKDESLPVRLGYYIIIFNGFHCVKIVYSIQYINTLYRFVA